MASRKPGSFFDEYTHDLTSVDVQRMFTRDTPEAYRFFTRGIDFERLAAEPWYRRWPMHARLFFTAFTMRLSPARRVLYAVAVIVAVLGLIRSFDGFGPMSVLVWPLTLTILGPHWTPGATALMLGFLLLNFLIVMEVADRLSLKSDLEVARDIQIAMLPRGMKTIGDAQVFGFTRPANTVGGDFYDILELADGRFALALGDVAGKGSPAALLMALLLAMLRTLADEGLEPARLLERLNVQVSRHSPASRFITLFYGIYDPRDGSLEYVNAGHLPPVVFRRARVFERLQGGGVALGMFEKSNYESHRATIAAGDVLVLFSDGITEAENASGQAFDEAGLESIIAGSHDPGPEDLARRVVAAVDAHAGDVRLADDLTVLALVRAK